MGPNPTEPAVLTNYFRDSRPTIDDTSAMMAQAPKVDALDIFLNSIGSRETKSKYKNKIDTFLTFVGLQGSLQDRANAFVDMAAKNRQWAFACIVKFLSAQGQIRR